MYNISKQHEEALIKNERLIEDLHYNRGTFCGIGTRLVKLMLNKHDDDVSKMYRLALEIEDINIQAKESRWKYKEKKYEQKEKLLEELWNLCGRNNVLFGKHEEAGYSTNRIVFFELPDTEQISWHTNACFVKDLPVYPYLWDGKVNSTLRKLQGVICTKYKGELIASAKRNKRGDVEPLLDFITEKHKESFSKSLAYKEEALKNLEKNRKIAQDIINNFKDTELYGFVFPLVKNPNLLVIKTEATQDKVGYSVKYCGETVSEGTVNLETETIDLNYKTKTGILHNLKARWLPEKKSVTVKELVDFVLGETPDFSYSFRNGNVVVERNDGKRIDRALRDYGAKEGDVFGMSKAVVSIIKKFDGTLKKIEGKERKKQEKSELKKIKKIKKTFGNE